MRNGRKDISFRMKSTATAMATAVVLVGWQTSAHAGVEVDLSVLNNSDNGQLSGSSGSALKMPGTVYPHSKYLGPAVNVPKRASMVTVPEPKPEPDMSVMTEPESVPEPVVEAPKVPAAPEPEQATAVTEPQVLPEPPSAASVDSNVTPTPPEPAAIDEPSMATVTTATASNSSNASTTESGPTSQTASIGNQATTTPTGTSRVIFAGEETRLPESAGDILTPIAEQLGNNDDLRIQLRAYAGGDDISSSKARRLSLSRALAVRSFLIEQGVRSTRIDVRALGNKVEDDPVNRVDIEIMNR